MRKERPMSAPSRIASDVIFTQQRNQLIVTVQIENTPGRKSILRHINQRNMPQLGVVSLVKLMSCRLRRIAGKINVVCLHSLNGDLFVALSSSLQESFVSRSISVPILSTNFNASHKSKKLSLTDW